jgi:dihydrodipicolinate synthase/N-acetylneuraminate lyase
LARIGGHWLRPILRRRFDSWYAAFCAALCSPLKVFIAYLQVVLGCDQPDWIAVIKRGLELRGRKVGAVRPPMLPLTDEVDARLEILATVAPSH